jgi:hypothetical protein
MDMCNESKPTPEEALPKQRHPRRITGQEYDPDDFDTFRQEDRATHALLAAWEYAYKNREALLDDSVILLSDDDFDLDDDGPPDVSATPIDFDMTRRMRARAIARMMLRGWQSKSAK